MNVANTTVARSQQTHIWIRAEQRPNEERVGLTPAGAAALIKAGIAVTIEHSATRALPKRNWTIGIVTVATA